MIFIYAFYLLIAIVLIAEYIYYRNFNKKP